MSYPFQHRTITKLRDEGKLFHGNEVARYTSFRGYCHRCERVTETVYLPLSSGDIGNCCSVCRATRKGRPYITKQQLRTLTASRPKGADEADPALQSRSM